MNFYKWTIPLSQINNKDLFIAFCWTMPIEGLEEQQQSLLLYAEEKNKDRVQSIMSDRGIDAELTYLADQNWNAIWESTFTPIIIDDLVAIRATFHDEIPHVANNIIITPKMSFGTGHHATTRLMLRSMNSLNLKDKTVLDFGTGTGVLAIFAEIKGASKVLGIDNDSWSINNALENIQANQMKQITISDKSINDFSDERFDLILANINRHVLVQFMEKMLSLTVPQGQVLVSGILKEDESIIHEVAENHGAILQAVTEEAKWICMQFEKSK